jgi:hypothetical protein
MLELTSKPIHTTRAAFDEELKRAGITLSPFPFERTFGSFADDPSVILYRCIEGDFNHRYDNKDWSLNPQHALEYSQSVQGSTNTLLMIQLAKVELCRNVNFYSRQGDKIGLAQRPDPRRIAKTSLTGEGSFLSAGWLRCMRKVIRFGVNPDDSMDRRFSSDFKPEELKCKAVLHEWQMAVSMAHGSDRLIVLSTDVRNDYNDRRGEFPEL